MSAAIAEIRLLLWVQVRSFANGLVRGEPSARLRNWGALILRMAAFIVVLLGCYAYFYISSLPSSILVRPDLFFLSLIHALGAILLLGAIKFAYQVFYLSDDLEWLLASPIPPSRIFIAKFTENWLYNGRFVLSMGWPLVIGYGLYIGAPFSYYPVAIASTALLAVYTGAIGVLVCLPLMRYVTAKRLRELLLTLSMGLSVGLYFIFRQMGMATDGGGVAYNPPWLPTAQLGTLLKNSAEGNWYPALISALLFVIPALLLAWISHRLSLRLYLQGLQKKGEAEALIRASKGEGLLYRISSLLPADIRAVALKDMLETIRSPRHWFYLLFAVLILSFQALGPLGPDNGAMHLFFLIFIASIFSQELTVLGISRESDMFPLVATSGIPAWHLYLAKWVTGLIPTALFGLIAATVIGFSLGETPLQVLADIGIVLLGIIPLVSYLVMIGCLFPNFKAYKTRRRLSPWVLIMNMFFTSVLTVLILIPLWVARQPGLEWMAGWIMGLLILFPIGVAATMFAVSFAVGSARLQRFLTDVPETT